MIFLDPKCDLAFKKLFANPARKDVTMCFLNAVLNRQEGEKIIDITILDPYNHPDTWWLKTSIVDVRCKDQSGNNYIIELQVEFQDDYPQRSVYYTAFAIARQLEKKSDYREVMPVIFIGILDFKLFKSPDAVSYHRILNEKTHEHALKHVEFCFIELPKFDKNLSECTGIIDKWIYLFKAARQMDEIPEEFNDPIELEFAMEALKQGNLTRQELDIYDRLIDEQRVARSIKGTQERLLAKEREMLAKQQETHARELQEAEDRIKKGIKKGMEAGMREGIKEGMEAGMREGVKEGMRELARKLLEKLDVDEIARLTGLPVDEIKKLK